MTHFKEEWERHCEMRPLCCLLIISLFISPSIATIVEETCKSISSSHPNVPYDFCVSSFESYEDSFLASDQITLAIIACHLANATAVKTGARIQQLMEEEKNQPRRNRLEVCLEEYSYATDEWKSAENAIDAGRISEAQIFASAALDAASNCEDAFAEAEDSSPLEDEDGKYGRLAAIALAIVAALPR